MTRGRRSMRKIRNRWRPRWRRPRLRSRRCRAAGRARDTCPCGCKGGGTAEERERAASDGGAARLKRLRPRSATA